MAVNQKVVGSTPARNESKKNLRYSVSGSTLFKHLSHSPSTIKYKWAHIRTIPEVAQNVTQWPILSITNPQTGDKKIGKKNGIDMICPANVGVKLYISHTKPVEMLLNGNTLPYVNTQLSEMTQKHMPRLLKSASLTLSDSSMPEPVYKRSDLSAFMSNIPTAIEHMNDMKHSKNQSRILLPMPDRILLLTFLALSLFLLIYFLSSVL